MLRTRLTELLGIAHPIVSAPMAFHSGGTLAGAVSAAGGLGSFGGVHPWRGPDWIHAEIAKIRAVTDRPFAVGFITAFMGFSEELFAATLDEHPRVIALSFGDPGPWAARAKDAGALVMCQVQSYTDAATAVAAGADVLVAQGNEAGGHTGTMALLPFVSGLVDRHRSCRCWPPAAFAKGAAWPPCSPPAPTGRGWARRFWPRRRRWRYTTCTRS